MMLFLSRWLVKNHSADNVRQVFSVLKPAVAGLIAAAALLMCSWDNFTDWRGVLIFAVSFIALYRYKISPLKIIAASGFLGLVFF